ncbi:MAG: sulfite exporter TauE/SafE family protein [Actinomycetaceae bacterium]|nr:sulfite exporter TauE/SafE family protein [Actinomycetaceae bacterium]
MELLIPAIILFTFMTAGTVVQSLSGIGFGMVAVPFLVAILGPAEGVLWGNIAGLTNALVMTFLKRRNINWKIFALMSGGALPLILIAIALQSFMSTAVLNLFVGALMLAMLLGSFFALRFPEINHPLFTIVNGSLAGFMSASVAQSGPVMAAYAQATRWKQEEFAATMQPIFIFFNIVAVPTKLAAGVEGNVLAAFGMSALTIFVGSVIARFLNVKPKSARKLALFIAFIGSSIVLWRGLQLTLLA